MWNLENKVAVVTGGSGVLGGAIARGFGENKMKVAILARTPESIKDRVEQIKQAGGEAIGLVADVLDEASLKEARDTVLEKWGRLDVLVNGAGGNIPGATITPDQSFFDLKFDDLGKINDLNFKGTVLATFIFGKTMVENKEGSVINISSMAAQRALTRVLGYSAAKAAVDNFTKWLAVEMALKYGDGIRINAIAPGFFVGEQNKNLLLKDDGSLTDRGQTIVNQTPMNRFGLPEELQGVANWLAGSGSAFVTGIVVPVDGGFGAFSGV